MQAYQLTESVKVNKNALKSIADVLAGEMANKMYYKLLMLRFLPEIKAVEEGKLKGLRGKEIHKFLGDLRAK